jgi:uncharacterized protein (DUF433 family)
MNEASPGTGRIDVNPAILGGKPFIRDTRLSVEFLQCLLETGWSAERILEVYQYLEEGDLSAMQRVNPAR